VETSKLASRGQSKVDNSEWRTQALVLVWDSFYYPKLDDKSVHP